MDNNRGLTLFQVLVIVFVIGIVAAVMVPQYSARKATRSSDHVPLVQSSLDHIDAFEKTLDLGNFAFKAPSIIDFKDHPPVELRISKKQTEEELKKSLTAKEKEQVESGQLKISDKIQATLTSTDFQITSLTPDTQLISSTNVFVWKWKIKPLHAGTASLHLSVNAMLEEGPYVLRSLDRDIAVTITTRDRVEAFINKYSEYLKWSWTALVVPIFLYAWKRYGKKKKGKKGGNRRRN
ncbi:hypothetical protein [Geobacter sp. DSM 9736]|uniref:hypothetical protein n=1 Tax=Geobacter sp. DSM 9736 TaxID=1277350 RepID=UPI000B514569|nr:hypothetical protein [Geobacter sp. DSM 9736]SNB46294.1 hypothetical protein SAMN06269301_1742 [Geobacter sp. DSM 9736]